MSRCRTWLKEILACMVVIGCTLNPALAALKNEVVTVIKAEPSNLDPHGNTELAAMTVQVQIFEPLVQKSADGKIIPCLAESWKQINDRTVRFKLRDNVYFHNGDKLTAEDVAFTIKRATVRPTSAAIFSAFDGENTKAVDTLTVDIVTKKPFAAIFNYLTNTRGGVVCKRVVEEVGDAAYGRKPVGTGPFKFSSWVSGTNLVLKRNDNYWGEKAKFETLIVKFITETANRALEIEAGNADIVLDPDANDLDRLKTVPGVKVITGNSYAISFLVIALDNKNEALRDHRVREAMALALDIPTIVSSVYGTYATPAESVIPATVFSYVSQGAHRYNVEKAKKLLADAGYAKGLNVRITLPNSAELQNIGIIAQNMWKQIGINAEIVTASISEVLASGRRGDNEISAMSATYATGDPGHALNDFDTRGDGWIRPNDTKINEMLDAGNAAYDTAERAAIYAKLQNYIFYQYWMLPVANKTVNYLIGEKVHGFVCNPGDMPHFVTVFVEE